MAATNNSAIVPIKLRLTEGDFYTLYAPAWKQHGAQWEAFAGDDSHIFVFTSPAEVLAWLEANPENELTEHPGWTRFAARGDERVVPDDRHVYSLIEVPAYLADRPSYENVTATQRCMDVAKALGNVGSLAPVNTFFASHSILGNLRRGHEHYASDETTGEWTGIGAVVLDNWGKVLDAIDEAVVVPPSDATAVADAQKRVDAAVAAAAAATDAKEEEAAAAEKEAENIDPYDASVWAHAGIDPIQITVDGKTVYTLRSFVDNQPVFLGSFGKIYTFNNRKALARWLMDHDDHDIAKLSTWHEIKDEASVGNLDVVVHEDNTYVLSGIKEDIAKGPDAVDIKQMGRAVELFADTADWARDDSMNATLLANPNFDRYIKYMLGNESGYVPSAPHTEEVNGWKLLENTLTERFSKF
ncbi:MAG: hypothetical protein SPK00_02145 [Corynebacterium glucuronolyticum]|nr:hypothetical protein [Corynebacterium glucuronolyticum]MDD7586129.1 hypothetical protein [Mycobacteriaceae bacterium]MDY5833540.1 hypothetical protein [Corynebacterium glucuronolyticum]